ncbi:MAG: sortase [Candidatus Saccharimonadales bacterium]
MKRLKVINSTLLALIILINCYIVVSPFIPGLQYWYKNHFVTKQRAQLSKSIKQGATYEGPNKLVIPQIFADQPVLEGPNVYTAVKGVWRLPTSSTPDKGGNTVLIGHRFLYSSTPSFFYNLDKVHQGNRIGIFWDNKQYLYEVSEVKVVSPEAIDIEAPTKDSRLTLYTCTPLWTSKSRLVVIAHLVGGKQ